MRDKLHAYLLERPSGATPRELLDLIFTRPRVDAEFGPRFIRTLLGADARFAFDDGSGRWVSTAHTALARALDDTAFVIVDLETTGGTPARGHGIIEIGALRVHGGRVVDRFNELVHPAAGCRSSSRSSPASPMRCSPIGRASRRCWRSSSPSRPARC